MWSFLWQSRLRPLGQQQLSKAEQLQASSKWKSSLHFLSNNNQIIPGSARRMQGDHGNGAWNPQKNGQQQQNPPNAYFQQNGKAHNLSCGVSMLGQAPVQAVVIKTCAVLAT
jgi:hypothetical protein